LAISAVSFAAQAVRPSTRPVFFVNVIGVSMPSRGRGRSRA